MKISNFYLSIQFIHKFWTKIIIFYLCLIFFIIFFFSNICKIFFQLHKKLKNHLFCLFDWFIKFYIKIQRSMIGTIHKQIRLYFSISHIKPNSPPTLYMKVLFTLTGTLHTISIILLTNRTIFAFILIVYQLYWVIFNWVGKTKPKCTW